MLNQNIMANRPLPNNKNCVIPERELLNFISFYHPGTTRHMAESMLLQSGVDGTYLMRPSSNPDKIVLSVRCLDSVKHYPLIWDGSGFHFDTLGGIGGMKSMLQFFNSRPSIAGESGVLTTLKFPYPREVDEPELYDSVKIAMPNFNNYFRTQPDEQCAPEFSLATKEGFLTKQGNFIKSWKLHWFTLRRNELRYYRNKKDNRPVKTLDLSQCTACIRDNTHGKDYCFSLTFPARTFYIHAATEQEMTEWMKLLNWKLRHRSESLASLTETTDITTLSSISLSSATSSLSTSIFTTISNCTFDSADGFVSSLDGATSSATSAISSATSTTSSASDPDRSELTKNSCDAELPSTTWYVNLNDYERQNSRTIWYRLLETSNVKTC